MGRLVVFLKDHTAEMHGEERQREKEGNRHIRVHILCLTTLLGQVGLAIWGPCFPWDTMLSMAL